MFARTIINRIEKLAIKNNVDRIDIVQDKYHSKSIKNATRTIRGTGVQICFEEADKLAQDFPSFLLNSENKTNLNKLISEIAAREITWNFRGEVLVTYGRGVRSNTDGPVLDMRFTDDVHEEADNRMIVHIIHMIDNKINKILVRTGDTDVIVILISFMPQFLLRDELTEIWVDFGLGKNRKIYGINQIYEHLGEAVALALPFFHAFTGCDSTASIFMKSKKFWFELWMSRINGPEDITAVFAQLSWQPKDITLQSNIDVLERLMVTAYSTRNQDPAMSLKEIRYNIFVTSPKMDLRLLPPSSGALKLHILRSAYQAGWIWGNSLSQRKTPDETSWGWTTTSADDKLHVLWRPLGENSTDDLKLLLTSCKCSGAKSKCTHCSCGNKKLPCLNTCSCKRNCSKLE